jgi:recombination protein RecR
MHHQTIAYVIDLLSKLPGFGPRSARRVLLHLIKKKDTVFAPLVKSLQDALTQLKACQICGNLDGHDPCQICTHQGRDKSTLCVVQEISDLWAVERTGVYRGVYHVLGGVLSPLDGVGPEELSIPALLNRVSDGSIQEVFLATNATSEGQATAHYITECLKGKVAVTCLALGIPMGGELDYLDETTLTSAIQLRKIA